MSDSIPVKDRHIVVVQFTTAPAEQAEAVQLVGDYVADFLSQQPGFIKSRLHSSLDGESMVHYAEWESEADFQAAGAKAQDHPDLPALRAYHPLGRGYVVARTFP